MERSLAKVVAFFISLPDLLKFHKTKYQVQSSKFKVQRKLVPLHPDLSPLGQSEVCTDVRRLAEKTL